MSDPKSEDQPRAANAMGRGPGGVFRRVRQSTRKFGHGFERELKRLLFAMLRALFGLGRPRTPPDWSAEHARVLLLRPDRIGDMVLITGLIQAIVRAQPKVTVDVLASPGNAAVLEGNPHVAQVLTVNKKQPASVLKTVWRIRHIRYTAVLDPIFPKPSLTNMLLMLLSGARYRVGIAGRGNEYALSLPVAPVQGAVHHIDQIAALLAAFGIDVNKISSAAAARPAACLPSLPSCRPATGWGIWPSAIYLSPSELTQGGRQWGAVSGQQLRLLVNVSAGAPERLWPEERFIALLNHVQARFPGIVALVAGTLADRGRMDRIAHGGGAQAAHTPHYRQMMAITAASDLVLTCDTSVTHVASAFGKPVLALFRGNEGDIFAPYSSGYALSTPAHSMDALPAEPVIQALEALIQLQLGTAAAAEPPLTA